MSRLAPIGRLRAVTWFAPSWPASSRRSIPELDAGSYVTDGWRLLRVVSPFDPGIEPQIAWLEDCMTLEVEPYEPDDLWEMDLRLVQAGEAL